MILRYLKIINGKLIWKTSINTEEEQEIFEQQLNKEGGRE